MAVTVTVAAPPSDVISSSGRFYNRPLPVEHLVVATADDDIVYIDNPSRRTLAIFAIYYEGVAPTGVHIYGRLSKKLPASLNPVGPVITGWKTLGSLTADTEVVAVADVLYEQYALWFEWDAGTTLTKAVVVLGGP